MRAGETRPVRAAPRTRVPLSAAPSLVQRDRERRRKSVSVSRGKGMGMGMGTDMGMSEENDVAYHGCGPVDSECRRGCGLT